MPTPTSNTPTKLMVSQQIPNADTSMYQSPAAPALGTRLTALILVNTSGAAATVCIYQTIGAAAGAVTNAIAYDIVIPGDGWPVNLPQINGIILIPGDRIRAWASAVSVTMHMYGIEMA